MKAMIFRTRRTIVAWLQAALLLGLPFIRVHGESALRFDVPSLKLYFFGSVLWISEAYFSLLVFLFFFIGIMLFTVLYGRFWCGWACPQTVLSDFSTALERLASRFKTPKLVRLGLSQALLAFLSIIVAASLIWYFVSPYDMLADITSKTLGPWTFGSWLFFSVLIYLDLAFIRRKFCTTVCPYARFQSAFFDDKTLTIAFDRARAEECQDCWACVRSCPAGIDIREGLQVECINCAECIDACGRQFEGKTNTPLIGYFRGASGSSVQTGARVRVVGLSIALAFIAVLFAHQIYVRVPMDFWVFRDEPQSFRKTDDAGSIMNAYSMTVENRSLNPGIFQLSISGVKDAELVVFSNPFLLPPDTSIKMKAYVFVKRKNLTYRATQLRFILENVESREIRIEQEAPFIYQEQTEQGREI
ncbi:MAG: 4Fe-4S binding protein [Nitrospiraceae bacterium]|nr:4Fe-4S binding protein [Nitrospiraceae bacterium]